MLVELRHGHRALAIRFRPPDMRPASKQRLANRWVGNPRNVELRRFNLHRVTNPDPVRQRPIREIDVAPSTSKGVGPEVPIANVEARLAAVANHRVVPGHRVAVVLPGAVVLRPALQLAAVEWADREALELQAGDALVDS